MWKSWKYRKYVFFTVVSRLVKLCKVFAGERDTDHHRRTNPSWYEKKRKFIRLFCCCFTNGLQFNSAAFGRLPCTRSSSTLVLCPRGNLVNSTIGNFAAHNRNSVRILFFISTYCVHAVEIIRKCPRLNIIQVVQQAHPCFHWVSPQVFVWLGHCFAHALVRCSFRTASNNVKRAV